MSSYDFDVIGLIHKTEFLPPYFAVAQKAIRLLGNPDLEFRELASVLETDQALVSKVLGLVNSPFYGLSRNISRIDEALSYLGLGETRNLVMAVSTKDAFAGQAAHNTWHHSLATAYLSEALAKYSRKKVDQNNAFTAGLVHDIGIAFIERKMLIADDDIRLKISLGKTRLEAEQSVLGFVHPVIGAYILQRWNVPKIIIEAVQYHHSPWQIDNPLVPIIALANQVSAAEQTREVTYDRKLLEFCQITVEDLRSLNSATQITISNFESRIAGS